MEPFATTKEKSSVTPHVSFGHTCQKVYSTDRSPAVQAPEAGFLLRNFHHRSLARQSAELSELLSPFPPGAQEDPERAK